MGIRFYFLKNAEHHGGVSDRFGINLANLGF